MIAHELAARTHQSTRTVTPLGRLITFSMLVGAVPPARARYGT
ncbi:MAG TPA: hypothetical protein VK895_13400 [Jiangellaceae bacterium]|nr:hypothetical protein [Jiangellaceae bacterium]